MVPLKNKQEQPTMTNKETQALYFGGPTTKTPPPTLDNSTEELDVLHKVSNMAATLGTSIKQKLAKFHHQSLCSLPILVISGILTRQPEELLLF